MTSVLYRAIAAVRAWIRVIVLDETRLHPSHGWLLPSSGDVRARALALAPIPVPVPFASGRPR